MRFKSKEIRKGIFYRDIIFGGKYLSISFIVSLIFFTFLIDFFVLHRSLSKAIVATSVPFFYLLFSTFASYLITRSKTLHRTIYLGMFSFYVFSYFLSTLFILLLLHGHLWQIIYNVWGAYTLAMSALMLYYITYSFWRAAFAVMISGGILIGIGYFAIDWKILIISFCILMVPTLIISAIMEGSKMQQNKMSHIARAYFESFLGNYRAIEGVQEVVGSFEEMQSDIIKIDPPGFFLVCNDIHYGPYKKVSASSMPGEIHEMDERIIVVKAPSTHRENLASSKYKEKMIKKIFETIPEIKTKEIRTSLARVEVHPVRVTMQSLGRAVLCSLDFLEEGYDDIPREVLLRLRKIFPEGVFIDAHSSRARDRSLKDIDEGILKKFERAVMECERKLEETEPEDLHASYYSSSPDFPELGKAGMKAFMLGGKNKKCLYFVFDSNNIVFDVKEAIKKEFEGENLLVEVISTDSHEKTTPSGMYDSLGHVTPTERILEECRKAYSFLKENLQRAKAGHRRVLHDVKILGDTWLSMLQMVFQNVKLIGYLLGFQAILMVILITLFVFVIRSSEIFGSSFPDTI